VKIKDNLTKITPNAKNITPSGTKLPHFNPKWGNFTPIGNPDVKCHHIYFREVDTLTPFTVVLIMNKKIFFLFFSQTTPSVSWGRKNSTMGS
jgi:hypothetical protein